MHDSESVFSLRSRVLFIDACIYHSGNFQFLTKDLASLSRLLELGQVTLLFTTVTVAEVKRHLKVQSSDAASAAQSFQQKAKILRNLPIFSKSVMFDPVNVSDIETELLSGFEKFLSSKNVEVLSVDMASADEVFDRYFNVQPPFSIKKPNEFRDAFVLETLKAYAQENGVRIHVVSTDKDMGDYCEGESRLIWSGKLGEIVNALMHSARTVPAEFADSAYASVKPEVVERVNEFLAEQDFGMIQDGESRVQGFHAVVGGLRSVNERVLSADRTYATYGVDFEFDVVTEYFQAEPPKPIGNASRDFLEVYKHKCKYVKTVEVLLYLDFFEGDIESVILDEFEIALPGGDILWDDECQETIRHKQFEF